MRCLENMDRIQMNNALMIQLFQLYENRGRSYYYKEVFERDDAVMARQTLEEDILSFGKFLELDITQTRMNLLSNTRKDYVPRKKDEKLLVNIKTAFKKIQSMAEEFVLNPNEAQDLATILYRGYENVNYRIRSSSSRKTFSDFEKSSSQQQLTMLIEQYHKIRKTNRYEVLTLISNFFVDFIKIKPFNKHNETIGLLLVYTMIAKEFHVCRYHSFFSIFLDYKERFELALSQSFYDWENGLSQTEPLVRVFIDTIEKMNGFVSEKEHVYVFEKKMNKTNSIEYVIYDLPTIFRKRDIVERLPLVSEATINRTLQILKYEGVIQPLGQGRSAQWQRLKDGNKKFTPEQLTLF